MDTNIHLKPNQSIYSAIECKDSDADEVVYDDVKLNENTHGDIDRIASDSEPDYQTSDPDRDDEKDDYKHIDTPDLENVVSSTHDDANHDGKELTKVNNDHDHSLGLKFLCLDDPENLVAYVEIRYYACSTGAIIW